MHNLLLFLLKFLIWCCSGDDDGSPARTATVLVFLGLFAAIGAAIWFF